MAETYVASTSLGRPWWVRLRAVLATGLVLGVGATTTLAAWTDEVVVEGEFAASTFTVEANSAKPYDGDSGSWAAYADEAAVLHFDADGMTPGSTRHASLALRTTTGSIGGQAVLNAAEPGAPTPLGEALRYRVIHSLDCDDAVFSSGADYLVGNAAEHVPLSTGQADGDRFELPGATPDGPGESVHLCFEVILPSGAPNELQGQTATATWSIDAISETT